MSALVVIPELPGVLFNFPVISVDYTPEAAITEHPVEFGAGVADHIQVKPLRFVIETMITASPTIPTPGVVDLAIAFLEQAQGKILNITIDGEGIFNSYALESWPHRLTVLQGRAFSLRFKQVRIATAISIIIPPRLPAPVAATGAATEQGLGQQPTAPVPSSTLFEVGSAILSIATGGG